MSRRYEELSGPEILERVTPSSTLLLPIGAVLDLGRVVDLVDSAFFLMAIPNIIALYVFAPDLRRDISAYIRARKRRETDS